MKFILVIAMVFVCGCSLFKKEEKPNKNVVALEKERKRILREFEKGNKYLDNKEYKKAKDTYNGILNKNPITSLDLIILFNSGVAYESLKNCKMAKKRYRRVVRAAKNHEKLKARALFRLSYAYICLGQNSKAIVNLIDVRKRAKYLPDEVALAEVPARLAAAYARNGNKKLAQRFFREAELGIRKLQAKYRNPQLKKETLAKTLFLMGNMRQLNPKSLEGDEYLASVRSLQGYLLQSVELDSKNWSRQAKDQLAIAYDQVWDLLESVPQNNELEKAMAKRDRLLVQGRLAQETIFNIEELRSLRFPDTKNLRLVKELFNDLNRQERKLRKFLAENNLGNSLTDEAMRRGGLKRDGRTYRPNPVLERKSKKATELPEKKTK